jgi:hypothetical protein
MFFSSAGMTSADAGLDQDLPHRALEGGAEDLALGGGERHHHQVVLVAPVQVLALGRQNAEHGEGRLADAEGLADRVFVAEQVLATVRPSTATRVAARRSESVKALPSAIGQERASR